MIQNLADEKKYLSDVMEQIKLKENELKEKEVGCSSDFKASMNYLWEHKSDMDAMEIFSNQQSINRIVDKGEFTNKILKQLQMLKDVPYFARIDFQEDDEDEIEKVYIGRFSFCDDHMNVWVYDWRAPISEMYYEYELGPAAYFAPIGKIEGVITTKRQYQIKNGQLLYAADNGSSIHDEVLLSELSKTSDKRMQDIVATIQKEQNQIIRREQKGTLIIQGVAGSGKTSVALHRIAYYLYRNKGSINAEHILIFSPNKVFADYISGVLPELGEEPICDKCIQDIAVELLEDEFETYEEQLERLLSKSDLAYDKRVKLKSSLQFAEQMEHYIDWLEDNNFVPKDYIYNGSVIEKKYIWRSFSQQRKMPVYERLRQMSIDIVQRIKEMNTMESKVPSKSEVYKVLCGMLLVKEPMTLYKQMFEWSHLEEAFIESKKLEFADVFPILYLKIYLFGVNQEDIRYVVIDEMQDYSPIELKVINKLYPCPKMLLGDMGQNINPAFELNKQGYEALYPDCQFVHLNKSYRSTCEIMELAQQVKKDAYIEPTLRHGDVPEKLTLPSHKQMIHYIQDRIEAFKKGTSGTLGILCYSRKEANALYEEIRTQEDVHFLDACKSFTQGVQICSTYMAKGLEFDEVIVVNSKQFSESLLYVACTRAMHQLTLLNE